MEAVAVLLGEKSRIVSRPMIEEIARQIVERFDPERIILFGSYAYGKPHRESDIDLLVVMETPLKETEQAIRICQAILYQYALDLLVRTPETLQRRIALGDRFLQKTARQGRVLYERSHPEPDEEGN